MPGGADFSVLTLLQPDLLSTNELINMLKSRCFRLENLSAMSRERLVQLFRQVVLPLPQRCYRDNRRGTMLTAARRAKADSGGGKSEGAGFEGTKNRDETKNPHFGCNRLKPPPNSSTFSKIRINSNSDKSFHSDKIVINDRRKTGENSDQKKDVFSQKVNLKRSSEIDSSEQTTSASAGKKQRKAIKWP